jgi:hypothetical protein
MFEDTTGKSESVNRGKTENTMVPRRANFLGKDCTCYACYYYYLIGNFVDEN